MLTLETLTGVQGEEEHLSFYTGRSLVVPLHYDYYEGRDVGGDKERIIVRTYQTIHPVFAGIIFNGIAEKNRRQGLTNNVDLDLWNADRLLTTEDMGTILLQKGNRVLYIEGNLDFGSEQIRRNLHQFLD
ncbi:MAG: hypothetical protein FH749_08360 [Firmicutes bacterium]|nr:hypothetical protein [Bacillota bacterium]